MGCDSVFSTHRTDLRALYHLRCLKKTKKLCSSAPLCAAPKKIPAACAQNTRCVRQKYLLRDKSKVYLREQLFYFFL